MNALIDTIFDPFIQWLISLQSYLESASVPVSRPIDPSGWLSPFTLLGPHWMNLIMNIFTMGFIYGIVYIVVNGSGLLQQFRNTVKWW